MNIRDLGNWDDGKEVELEIFPLSRDVYKTPISKAPGWQWRVKIGDITTMGSDCGVEVFSTRWTALAHANDFLLFSFKEEVSKRGKA